MRLFTEHCAGCHQIAARGRLRHGRARAAADAGDADTQIAEAVRIGPYVMPQLLADARSRTGSSTRSSATSTTRSIPTIAGGWALGHLGPMPEGIVDLAHRMRGARRVAC